MNNEVFFETLFRHSIWKDMDRSRFVTDTDSMLGDESVFDWLITLAKPQTIIELGSWKGHSANYMADRCRELSLNTRIICVDTFLGASEHWLISGDLEKLHRINGMPSIYDRFLANTVERGNTDHIFPLTLDSQNAAEVFRHFEFRSDLIFVDAAHDYDDVVADITRYMPFVAEGGIMFGDDYQFEPLANAVHDCANKLAMDVVVMGRKWIFRPSDSPPLSLPPGAKIRTSFEGFTAELAHFGFHNTEEYLNAHIVAQRALIVERDAQIAKLFDDISELRKRLDIMYERKARSLMIPLPW